MNQGRSIRLFLADGTPGGIITAEIMNWTGHALFAPRSRLADLIKRTEASRTGVYFLVGQDQSNGFKPLLYIGETDNVGKRLAQHNKDEAKDFWEATCLITSKDQNLTKAHVRYLEARLITIANEVGRAKLVNSTAPDFAILPEADTADMEFFIEQIRVILPVLGQDFLRATTAVNSGMVGSETTGDGSGNGIPIELTARAIASSRFRPSTLGHRSPEFELRDTKLSLTAYAMEIDGEFAVLDGSQARKDIGDSLTSSTSDKRQELIASGILRDDPNNARVYRFTSDYPFSSPSQASTIIFARSDNGRKSWTVRGTRKTYAQWQEELVASASADNTKSLDDRD